MKRLLLYILLGFCTLHIAAQSYTFEVRSFRLLPNDITAYIDPVRDLNDEACALIKVVADKNFAFSTPLGIVKRQEAVGEIWIYVPKGTNCITIKHPLWGVLRDFQFPNLLESRLTYELVLAPPVDLSQAMERRLRVNSRLRPLSVSYELPDELPVPEKKRIKRPKLPLSKLVMFNVGVRESLPSFGLSVAIMRRHGFYLRGLSNFRTASTHYEAGKDGVLMNSSTKPYYTGATTDSRHTFTAGGIHRLSSSLYLYEGVGYGNKKQAWETTENEWVQITNYSHRGVTGEAGAVWKLGKWTVSLGVLTIKATYWEVVTGIGFNF